MNELSRRRVRAELAPDAEFYNCQGPIDAIDAIVDLALGPAVANSLPLSPWLDIDVTALAEHPADPFTSTSPPSDGRRENLT